jgi:hypothetical protein
MRKNMTINAYLKTFVTLGTLLTVLPSFAWHYDGSISGGATMPRIRSQEHVMVFDGLTNRYVTQRTTNTQGLWGGAAAVHLTLSQYHHIDGSIGLAGYALNYGTVGGVKHPYANLADFDPLNYSFKAKSDVGLIEGHLFYTGVDWQPYLLAGIGRANNRLSSYQETPFGTAVPGQLFTNASHRDTVVEIGFGLKHQLFQDVSGKVFSIALDYRYFNTGSAHLGPFSGQTTKGRLGINNLETDALLLSLNVTV